MDGNDISKKHAKYMEGLEFVKNGDTGEIGLGYNVININAVNAHKEISPLLSRAYSFEMGALSSNKEIKKAVRKVKGHLGDKGCLGVRPRRGQRDPEGFLHRRMCPGHR